MQVKVKDLEKIELLSTIVDILNKGNEVHIKKESNGVAVIEERRRLKLKLPTND